MLRIVLLITVACVCGCSQPEQAGPLPSPQKAFEVGLAVRGSSFDSDGVTIQFYDTGPLTGEPVLWLHGFLDNGSRTVNRPTAVALAQAGYRVIAPDLRGHGDSDKPHQRGEYGEKMVQDVINLLDHLELPRAQFIGYSMGGFILAKLTVDHPDRVSSAVIGGSGGIQEDYDFSFADAFANAIAEGAGAGDAMIASWDRLKAGPLGSEQREAFLALNELDGLAFAAVTSGWRDLMVSKEQLKGVSAPMLVIYGSLEMPNIKSHAEELATLVPDCETIIIAGVDHMTTTASEEFEKGVIRFVKGRHTK